MSRAASSGRCPRAAAPRRPRPPRRRTSGRACPRAGSPRRRRCGRSATRRSSPTTSSSASDAHLDAAMVRFRKKWWLPAMNRAAASPPTTAIDARQVAQQQVAGRLASACAARRPCSGPGRRARRRRSARGARASAPAAGRGRRGRSAAARPTRRRRRRTTASARRPRSASRTRAREPSSTTQTGIDGEQTPVIGPTCACSLPDASAISPRSSSAARLLAIARPALEHHGREHRPPLRIAHPLPRDRRPRVQQHPVAAARASTAPAGATVTACGVHASIRRTASALAVRPPSRAAPTAASARRASPRRRPPAAASRPATTGAPWSRSASANWSRPEVHGLDLA